MAREADSPLPDIVNEPMQIALAEARAAADRGEVPVGAVVVRDGLILSRAGNRRMNHALYVAAICVAILGMEGWREWNSYDAAVQRAVRAAQQRARELGDEFAG